MMFGLISKKRHEAEVAELRDRLATMRGSLAAAENAAKDAEIFLLQEARDQYAGMYAERVGQLNETHTEIAALKADVARLREFCKSFNFTVTDSFYEDAYLNVRSPHSAAFKLGNGSQFSKFIAELEKARRAALTTPAPAASESPVVDSETASDCHQQDLMSSGDQQAAASDVEPVKPQTWAILTPECCDEFGTNPECECPHEHWHVGAAGCCLDIHVEEEGYTHIILTHDDELELQLHGVSTIENARPIAFLWAATLIGEDISHAHPPADTPRALPSFCELGSEVERRVVYEVQGIRSIVTPNEQEIGVIAEAVWNGLCDSGAVRKLIDTTTTDPIAEAVAGERELVSDAIGFDPLGFVTEARQHAKDMPKCIQRDYLNVALDKLERIAAARVR